MVYFRLAALGINEKLSSHRENCDLFVPPVVGFRAPRIYIDRSTEAEAASNGGIGLTALVPLPKLNLGLSSELVVFIIDVMGTRFGTHRF